MSQEGRCFLRKDTRRPAVLAGVIVAVDDVADGVVAAEVLLDDLVLEGTLVDTPTR